MKSYKNISESLKKQLNKNIPLLILCGFLIVIFITIIFSILNKDEPKATTKFNQEDVNNNTVGEWDTTGFCVVKEIDKANSKLTVLDIESGQDIILNFSGGTDIRDKYDQIIAVSQISIGEMMDIYYQKNSAKLKKAVISTTAWEYKGVSNWYLNKDNNSFVIVDSKYQYSEDLVISRDGKLLTISDLDEKDELTVKGLDREVYSIIVTRGHGTLRFTDYDDFIGGIAHIGKREIVPIVEDLVITARAGTFDITFEKNGYVGVKKVILNPEDDITISMEEFKKPPVQTGLVKFEIEPVGAQLYINKILYSYEDMVELEYGEYDITVSLGGYSTYKGELVVNDVAETVSITLVESSKDNSETNNDETDNTIDDEENIDETIDGTTEEITDETTEEATDGTIDKTTDGSTTGTTSQYIYIDRPNEASAYLDGEFKGNVPVSFPKVIGTHYITFIKSGYETKTYTVEILDDGENVKLEFPELTKVE